MDCKTTRNRRYRIAYWNRKAGHPGKADTLTDEARRLENAYQRKHRCLYRDKINARQRERYAEKNRIIQEYKRITSNGKRQV